MKKWNKLPARIANELVKPYYDLIRKKVFYRFLKRLFDIAASMFLILVCFLPCLVISMLIILDSKGGVFFVQKRIGRYGQTFRIIKFRTMKKNSEGDQHVTHKNDSRVTRIGKFLRKTHLDEVPQLLNVLSGQMSFVGTRPEVEQFVNLYADEWFATLLMRPGVTSTASFSFDDEAKDIRPENADKDYLLVVLPKKMKFNLEDLNKMSLFRDISILFKTVFRRV